MITTGKVAPTYLEMDDLLVGISPFMCGFRNMGEQGQTILDRARRFDLQQSGYAQVTLAEMDQLSTKTVVLPTDDFQARTMLEGTSLVLDEIHGPAHQHAHNFRTWLYPHWKEMEGRVRAMRYEDIQAQPRIWARIVRKVHLVMVNYLRKLTQPGPGGEAPTAPDYTDIAEIVLQGRWSELGDVPARYIQPTVPKGTGTGKGGEHGPGDQTGSTAVQNSAPNRGWITLYEGSGLRIADIKERAPRDTDGTAICLAYQLRGSCNANCARRSTHKQLSGATLRKFNAFVNETLVTPGGGGTPATGGGPAAAGVPPVAAN